MAGWTMGVEAGNRQEGQPSQITFSQPTKFLIRFTVSCDSSSDGITQPRANLWEARGLACGQTCELFARVDLSDQSAAMAAIAMVFRTENRRPRDPRSKPSRPNYATCSLTLLTTRPRRHCHFTIWNPQKSGDPNRQFSLCYGLFPCSEPF